MRRYIREQYRRPRSGRDIHEEHASRRARMRHEAPDFLSHFNVVVVKASMDVCPGRF